MTEKEKKKKNATQLYVMMFVEVIFCIKESKYIESLAAAVIKNSYKIKTLSINGFGVYDLAYDKDWKLLSTWKPLVTGHINDSASSTEVTEHV